MKNIILCAIFAAAFPLSATAGQPPDSAADGFTGNVKSVTINQVSMIKKSGSWTSGRSAVLSRLAYDSGGKRTEKTVYNGPTIASKLLYIYRDKKSDPFCDEILRRDERWDSSFDREEKDDLRIFCEDHKAHTYKVLYIYDTSTGAEKKDKNGTAGILQSRLVSLVDKKNLITSEYDFDITGALNFKRIYKYDKENNIDSIIKTSPDDQTLERHAWKYDETGRVTERSEFGAYNAPVSKHIRQLRPDEPPAKETTILYNQDGSVSSRVEAAYDRKGGKTTETVYAGDNPDRILSERSCAYDYDAGGNWTKRSCTQTAVTYGKKVTDAHAAPEITERQIEYFKTDK